MKKLSKINLILSLLVLFQINMKAQQIITIPIETKDNAMVLQTDKDNRLGIVHFGKKLLQNNDNALIAKSLNLRDSNGSEGVYNNAYTPSGTWNIVEPAIRITHNDGNTSLDLKYVSHETKKSDDNVSQVNVLLKDLVYPVEVTLCYKIYAKENVVEQWSIIKHQEKGNVLLNKFASANLYMISDNFYLRHYHGEWAREMKPEETKLSHGIHTLDSKLGTRADLLQPPTFMLSFDRPATEDEGKVMLANLAWSGNYKIDFEMDSFNNLRLIAGINNHASEYSLKPNTEFVTPALIYTVSEHGKSQASKNMHDWARKYQLLDGQGSRLTLLNNWEATYFDFDEPKLVNLFKDAKKLGVDMFLLDDGWFANKYPRNNDLAGLGDWQENKKKLPNGIGYLVKEATKAGVKFGIWVEPEMVNPKSELYEKHLDWVIREPQRPEVYYRHQLPLDLTNPEVQEHVYGLLDGLFTKNPDLAFVKWDCNAVTYNAHSAYLEKQGLPQTHLYVEYVRCLYKVLDRLRAKYPKIPMMLCSGGGARVDYGALKYFSEFWASDNTDPLERVFIQYEYSYFFPSIAMCNHVTDWSKLGIKYRTDVAIMGKLGFDIVVNNFNEKELKYTQGALLHYKNVNDLIWHGDLYRLQSPWEKPFASIMYANAARDHALMFNYLTNTRYEGGSHSYMPVKMKGLSPTKRYKIKEINLFPDKPSSLNPDLIYSGDYLMNIGLNPNITDSRTSVVIELVEVK